MNFSGTAAFCPLKRCKEMLISRCAEVIITLLAFLIFPVSGLNAAGLRNFMFACCLVFISRSDIENMVIPNSLLIIASSIWLIFSYRVYEGDLKEIGLRLGAAVLALLFLLLLSVLSDRILKKESLGGGDIKLVGTAALYLGFTGTLYMLLTAGLTALIIVSLTRRMHEEDRIYFPFAPAISLSCVAVLVQL